MKKLVSILTIFLVCLSLEAQTSLDISSLSVPSKISTGYFGPNAFPVPEMPDGRTSSRWKMEVYGDHFFSTRYDWHEDYATDIFVRLTIPLFSPRVNLVLWGPLYEFFHSGASVNEFRRLSFKDDVDYHTPGDIYVSADIQTLVQDRHGLDMMVRAALKTASGDRYEYARYYDSPGYFFDATFGRELLPAGGNVALRVALSGGFLCWQTDNGRQNDAVMYGALASFRAGSFSLKAQYGGYMGWEGEGDAPMTLRADAGWSFGDFSVNAGYQVGFNDWPFHQIRLGVQYAFF